MLCMETIGRIRRMKYVQGKGIKQIARELKVSRNTLRNVVRAPEPTMKYLRRNQPRPKLGAFLPTLETWLEQEAVLPARQRRTARRLFEALQVEGYAGREDSVRRYVGAWRKARLALPADVFVPLRFAPGEAYQFDWSHEQVEIGGVPQAVKVAHFRLCHSRRPFVVAYPREAQEMVLDAHVRAFAAFGGVPKRGIYDNLKTAVDQALRGKDRKFNRHFLRLCAHYLVEPTACTPAAGWEKGQVENQVSDLRAALFTPRPRVADFDELNAHLAARCQELALRRRHPQIKDRTVAEVFEAEQQSLLPLPKPFDACVTDDFRVSSTSLIQFDRNRYSVDCRAVGKIATARIYAQRLVVLLDGEIVAEHPRQFGRDKTVYDPWHYVPVLQRKPGALRNGAPFMGWQLPAGLRRMRSRLEGSKDGDRQFAAILAAVLTDGLEAVDAACLEILTQGMGSSDAVLNAVARARHPDPGAPIDIPQALTLTREPVADCARYDRLRQVA